MVAEYLKKKILYFKKGAAVEVFIDENSDLSIGLVTGALRNNKIDKTSEAFVIDSVEKLAGKIGSNTPVSVIINGKSVLVKEIRLRDDQKNSNLVALAFPEIDHSKFYSSIFKSQQIAIISIARKEVIDEMIQKLLKQDLQIYNVSIGINVIENIFPFIDVKATRTIDTNWFKVSLDEQKTIISLEQKINVDKSWTGKHEYLIGNQYIHPFTILPFSALIELLAQNLDLTQSLSSDPLSAKRNEFKWKRYFNITAIGILIFVFIILAVNYILFSSLYSKNQQLQLQLPYLAGNTHQDQTELKANGHIIEYINANNWNKGTKVSYYTDRVASLLPKELTLVSIELYPEKKTMSNFSQSLRFSEGTVIVRGISPDPSYVNAFMNNLGTLPGLETVKLKKYSKNKDKNLNEFNLELKVK
jgi:hypothetical protein